MDCGLDAAGECALCKSGMGCRSTDDCEDSLVCSAGGVCALAARPAGTYVELSGLRLQGISKTQFVQGVATVLEELLQDASGAVSVVVTRVQGTDEVEDEEDNGTTRRLNPAGVRGGGGWRSMQSDGDNGVVVDVDMQYEASTRVFEAAAAAASYIEGGANGDSGLVADLGAAVPSISGRVSVDASDMGMASEVLREETMTPDLEGGASGADNPADGGGDDGDEGSGGLGAGAVVGVVVGCFALFALVTFLAVQFSLVEMCPRHARETRVAQSEAPTDCRTG